MKVLKLIVAICLIGSTKAAYKRYEGEFCTKDVDCLTSGNQCCDATKPGEIGLMVCSDPKLATVQTGEYYGYSFKCEFVAGAI